MKEIKAYVRKFKIEGVIRALEKAGVPGLCVIDVNAISFPSEIELEREKMSLKYGERYRDVCKLEIVCHSEDVTRFVGIIREKAYTSHKGDGYIFISEIIEAIKIRTGETGEDILRKL